MAPEPTPAIVRDFTKEDANATVRSTPKDSVSFHRGLGDSGNRVQTVEHDCPNCTFDRMIRRVRVSPVERDSVQYWCLNPNCVHFVSDSLSYACHGSYPQRNTDTPAVVSE